MKVACLGSAPSRPFIQVAENFRFLPDLSEAEGLVNGRDSEGVVFFGPISLPQVNIRRDREIDPENATPSDFSRFLGAEMRGILICLAAGPFSFGRVRKTGS